MAYIYKQYEGQNPWLLGRLGSGEDDFGQAWDGVSARDGESVAKVVPERDFELGAGFGETEKGIAAITTDIAAGAGTDLPPGDVAADVVLRSVGVQRDFGSVEHHQQLGLVGVEPREQAVERDEAGLALEDAVEPRPQASWIQPKRCGNWGWYFMVLKWLSENGLSLDVCGRLWDLVTPRSASRSAVVLARMGPPRSACRVNWLGGTECLAMASLNSALNRVALSLSATHQPTILRLKMSMMT